MFDLIIVGGGAASQSAAMYAIGKQLNFLMIYEHLGGRAGQVALADRDYLVGNILVHFDFPDAQDDEALLIGSSAIHLFERQIKNQANHLLQDRVLRVLHGDDGFAVETLRNGVRQARTVLVATGATPRKLELAGFDTALMPDISHVTTVHASTYAHKRVAIVGGQERGLYGVAELATRASCVYLVVPGAFLPNTPIVQVLRNHGNVEVFENCTVREVAGGDAIEWVIIEDGVRLVTLPADAAFTNLGYVPNVGAVQELVALDGKHFIRVDSANATNVPGLFAAGDVARPYGDQVLVAIGDGTRAAISAHHYLLERGAALHVGQLASNATAAR
ncbi:MAG: NAD(P)/FAD-dependent oxidoreductase [Chloroflexaceae bacterium]|jgi:thioredoxin reductase (NADPH)/alkyl hydroperoxide reductase subunit F|nr:NAD(P)/FAD-dependent oxidoreductase [Chloroflexaceae bacterium]